MIELMSVQIQDNMITQQRIKKQPKLFNFYTFKSPSNTKKKNITQGAME